ncbi:MAG: hypothetical protein V5A56_04520 [Halolamina sp.]
MASLTELIPMDLLFVAIFGFLPVLVTIYDRETEAISSIEWVSYGLIIVGSILVYIVSTLRSSVEMQRYLWPLLGIMGVGFLLYRKVLIDRGDWDEASIKRGATSYEE